MCNLSRKQKEIIRKRDAKRIKLTGVCKLCGVTAKTSRHHLFYNPDRHDPAAIIEVCDKCDRQIHDRDHNDDWQRELKAVRTVMLQFTSEKGRYDVVVKDKVVGCAYTTNEGIKLKIHD